jgi:Fe(3+) dicitrate transport protein
MILTQAGVKGNQENQVRSANSLATYLQYDLHYKGLTLSPGVRVEKINLALDNYGNADFARLGTALLSASNALTATMPGIGFNYEFNPRMSAFGGVHKGFSPPGPPTTNSTNGQAVEETAVNYEAGYRYKNNLVLAQVTGFLSQYSNLLGSDNLSGGGAGTGNMFNGGKARIKGIEASLEIDLLRNQGMQKGIRVPLSLAYTYTHAQFQNTFFNYAGGDWGSGTIQAGDRIPFVTPHLLTALISFEAPRLNATLTSRYTGLTRIKPGQGDNITIPSANTKYTDVNALKAYWVFDLSANYSIAPKVQLFTLINNLFDQDFIVSNLPQGYRPGMPFAFNGGIKVSL